MIRRARHLLGSVGLAAALLGALAGPAAAADSTPGYSVQTLHFDVAPNGDITLPYRLISPVRIPDVSKPITVQLPGIVHRVPRGHHLELVIAGGDAAYKGNQVSSQVTINTDPGDPGLLRLPVLPRESHAGGGRHHDER